MTFEEFVESPVTEQAILIPIILDILLYIFLSLIYFFNFVYMFLCLSWSMLVLIS